MLTKQSLGKNLKAMGKKAAYFITSDDDFIAANRAREIFEELSKDALDEMSKEVIDGASQKVEDAARACAQTLQAAATLPLFGGAKYVWLRNANFFGDAKILKNEEVATTLAKLVEYLKKLSPENAVVVINASPVDRRSKIFKEFSAFAESEDFQAKDPISACSELIRNESAALGIRFEPGAAETLASIVACNPRMCVQEVKKLAAYVNFKGTITQKDVAEMVPIFGESDFFDITNAFYSGNLESALAVLKRYFFANKKASARPIITAIQKQNSILIQLRALMDSGEISKRAEPQPRGALEAAGAKYAEVFAGCDEKTPYNVFSQNPWYAGSKLAPIAARIPLKKLLDSQMRIAAAFEALLSPDTNDEAVMRDFFVRVMS